MAKIETEVWPIETKKYIEHALNFNSEEMRLRELAISEVPDGAIDMHTHMGLASYSAGMDPVFLSRLVSIYPYFSYEDHLKVRSALWDNRKDVRQVVFTFPLRGIDFRAGNQYIEKICAKDEALIPFLTGDPYDNRYTLSQLDNPNWKGLKMYSKLMWEEVHRIVDFFPWPVLEKTNDLGLPITLHLPHNLMWDIDELVDLARRYENMTFLIAHFGIARGNREEINRAIAMTEDSPNIVYETSFYVLPEVISEALRRVGPQRIVYGSDRPLDLVRAKFVFGQNGEERLITDYPYHWVNKKEQDSLRTKIVVDPSEIPNIYFTSLFALLDAIKEVYPSFQEQLSVKQTIFVDNPSRILKLL
ncbi:MAG: amidohydrolase family protein [Candidatus Woesebacteria bacterium]|nr:amidohydrolase family protein [Candidatus Woesebacteria bacterium]